MRRIVKRMRAGKFPRLLVLASAVLFAAVLSLSPAQAAQVAVTVETLTENGGFIAEPELVTLPYGATAGQVTLSFLETKGITPIYAGGPKSSYFYVKNIAGYGDDGTKGWMITVGNTFIKTSAGVHALKNGDVVRWQYTSNYGRDLGAGDIWEWDFTPTPIPSEKPGKDDLIWKVALINSAGNKSAYGNAYDTAMSVLKNLNASAADISSALSALDSDGSGGSNGDTDNSGGSSGDTDTDGSGGSNGGADSEIAAEPAVAPPSGIEAGIKPREITAGDLAALLGSSGAVSTNEDGLVTASVSASKAALATSGITPDAGRPMTPLPAFRADVSGSGATALVTLRQKLDGYDGEELGSISVFKMTSAKTAVKLVMAQSAASLTDGSFVWTDGSGNFKQPTEKAVAGASYFISVAIKDDDDFDIDKRAGTIVDPLVLAIEDTNSSSTGEGSNNTGAESPGGGGGCDTGIGVFALAVLGFMTARGRGRQNR
jgi:uncharacterized membrane protein YgcG